VEFKHLTGTSKISNVNLAFELNSGVSFFLVQGIENWLPSNINYSSGYCYEIAAFSISVFYAKMK
jgi:hypothetical protein